MLQVMTVFRPFRLKISRKEPVELTVLLTNPGPSSAMVSLDLSCGRELSFDKGGFKATEHESLGDIPPGSRIEKIFHLHAKPVTRQGNYTIAIKATEHYKSYNLVEHEYTKKAELIVEE